MEAERVQEIVERLTGTGQSRGGKLDLSPGTQQVLEYAVEEARRMGHHYIGTEHLLLGLVRYGEGVAIDVLRKLGVTPEQIRRQTRRVLQESTASRRTSTGQTEQKAARQEQQKPKTPMVDQLATDLTTLAEDEKLDPVIGRQMEIERVIQILARVSHETIYRTLFIQARGALKKELLQHLRRSRGMRRSLHHTQKTADHGRITGTVSIRERPAEAEDRAVPGHWEGDLFFGSHNSQIATLVERQTRYVILAKVASKDTETVVNALIRQAHKLPRELYRSLTWDRGKAMADHQRFSLATDIQIYFCDPQQPWQRGSNENTNGLLRQYFPSTALSRRHSPH